MKNMFIWIAIATATPAAAVPSLMTYAARVENDLGPFDGTVSATFQLFDTATGGTELWSENVASAIVLDGDLIHELGSVAPLDDAVLASDDLFLAVTLNGEALEPRAALRAVPFALKARDAETLGGLSADDFATASQLDEEIEDAIDTARTGVSFQDLVDVPAGFADAQDNDTELDAVIGGGLEISTVVLGFETIRIVPEGLNAAHLADNAVGSSEVAVDSLTAADIAAGAVTTSEILDQTIGTADIADQAVTTQKIRDGAIGTAALATNFLRDEHFFGFEVAVRRLPIVNNQPICGNGITIDTTCLTLVCDDDGAGGQAFYTCDGGCDLALDAPASCPVNSAPAGFVLSAAIDD